MSDVLLAATKESNAYKNFINTVDSEATKKSYRYTFAKFMGFCGIDDYDKMLLIEPKKLEGIISDYITHLKVDKKLAYNTVSLYIASVSHFYSMNSITINWKRLSKFKGKRRSVVEDKPYSKEMIRQMLDFANLRLKCILTLMCSGGLRRGAIPRLRMRDLEKIEKYSLYKVSVYKKEEEAYTTFVTPECTKYLDQYFQWRALQGEVLIDTSPVVRKDFNSLTVDRPEAITDHAIDWLINNLLDKSCIRPRTQNKLCKTDYMQNHAARKFFNTTAKTAGLDSLYLQRLMGHDTGLDESYFKPTDKDMLEGSEKNLGYIGIMDALTINSENILQREIRDLRAREVQHCEEWESIRKEIGELRQKFLKH